MATVQIHAMRSWGELGNLLAARALASTLEDPMGKPPQVSEAESWLPRFAEIGDQIEVIAKSPRLQPNERHRRYMALMENVGRFFYPGFENEELTDPLASELRTLIELFGDTKPDLVVGTKGVISRVCLAALRRVGHPSRLVNFVTNEGLLTIDIHRSRIVPHHFVPFESAREYLVGQHGILASQVRTVGRLIAQAEIPKFIEAGSQSVAQDGRGRSFENETAIRVLVFSNRGGAPYLRILECLAERSPSLGVVFVGYNDHELVRDAERLKQHRNLHSWRIATRLDQGDYLHCVRWLAQAEYPLLISKTGPNTMLEAVYYGVPQLLLNSGLPMEQWVIPFLHRHRIGAGFEDVEELLRELRCWLDQPSEIANRRQSAKEFSRTLMVQNQVVRCIREAFLEVVRAPPCVSPA